MTKASIIYLDIEAMHKALGIPKSYPGNCGLEFQPDCVNLVATEKDVFDRQPFLEAETFIAWQSMQKSARTNGIELQIVSAFRSTEYQATLLQKKIDAGQAIEDILQVNAAPGFSEHHSGCAVDITTPGFEPLAEDFENSPAFAWLCKNADNFAFKLSFPKNNSSGILYEPWHWKYTGG